MPNDEARTYPKIALRFHWLCGFITGLSVGAGLGTWLVQR